MIKYKLLIQQLLSIQTQVVTYYKIVSSNVMIKIIVVKNKTIQNQQKQTSQTVFQEQRVYLLSVIVLCI